MVVADTDADKLAAAMGGLGINEIEELEPAVWEGAVLLGVSAHTAVAFDRTTGALYSRAHVHGQFSGDGVLLAASPGSAQLDSLPLLHIHEELQLVTVYDDSGVIQAWNYLTGTEVHRSRLVLADGLQPTPNALLVADVQIPDSPPSIQVVVACSPTEERSLLMVQTLGTDHWDYLEAPGGITALCADESHSGSIWGSCFDGLWTLNLMLPPALRVAIVASAWRDTLLSEEASPDSVRYRLLVNRHAAVVKDYADQAAGTTELAPILVSQCERSFSGRTSPEPDLLIKELRTFRFDKTVPEAFWFHSVEYRDDVFTLASEQTVLVLSGKAVLPHIPQQHVLSAKTIGGGATTVMLTASKEVIAVNPRAKTTAKRFIKEHREGPDDAHPVTENAPTSCALAVEASGVHSYCYAITFTDKLFSFNVK